MVAGSVEELCRKRLGGATTFTLVMTAKTKGNQNPKGERKGNRGEERGTYTNKSFKSANEKCQKGLLGRQRKQTGSPTLSRGDNGLKTKDMSAVTIMAWGLIVKKQSSKK